MSRPNLRRWAWPSELRRLGILGINARNAEYVLPNNPRQYYPRVDNKLITKEICQQHGIRVPETFSVVRRHGDVKEFGQLIGDRHEFVIKPACGAEGRGIMVLAQREGETFITSSGMHVPLADVCYHLSTILSGLYSLGAQPDVAIVEQRIMRHPAFETISVGGTPDIRIILFRGVPVMAMVRLPTAGSRGRANLHQGAIAAAVDLGTGLTCGGVCKGRAVSIHPDTNKSIDGFEVPQWTELLRQSIDLADVLQLGYVGVDFVVDASSGPVVLEANARPGLAIQVANRCGLRPRLELVDARVIGTLSREDRLELSRHFTRL